MNISKHFISQKQLIDSHLDYLIPAKDRLHEAARYSLLGTAKRIRPILTLATTEALNGSSKAALAPACALEMIHTYSLIHDDLPCMDNDDFRRGKPTLHKAYGEAEAVLAGDFLLTHAFQTISEAPSLTPDQKVSLSANLGKNAGGYGMILGQLMDMENEGKKIDIELLKTIHRRKTGALITSSIEFGGIISHANSHTMALLHAFGQEIGLAFQIIDDVLDHAEENSDAANRKATYVTIMGYDNAKEMAQELLKSSHQILAKIPHDTTLLKEIAHYMIARDT
jgi:geranylgeranyl diphosphate synthase type II